MGKMFKNHFFEQNPKFFLSCFFPFDTSSWQNSAPGLSLLCWILVWEHGLIQLQEHRNVTVMVSIALQKWLPVSKAFAKIMIILINLKLSHVHSGSPGKLPAAPAWPWPPAQETWLLPRPAMVVKIVVFFKTHFTRHKEAIDAEVYTMLMRFIICVMRDLENKDTAEKLFAAWCWWLEWWW